MPVEVGQEVTVEVLDVDMDRERVSLSLKSTQEDPWQRFARTHQIGQVIPGRVTKLIPFGAFVRVEEGLEGLVRISELADRHVGDPGAGRSGGRRDLRQDHRHRPGPAPDQPVAQAGTEGGNGAHAMKSATPIGGDTFLRVGRTSASITCPRCYSLRPVSGC